MPTTQSTISSSAEFSDDGHHRYSLTRVIEGKHGSNLLFVLLNPSKADVLVNDITVMNCQNIAFRDAHEAMGCIRAFRVCNLYACIATDPRDLSPIQGHLYTPEQQRNDCAIREACCWAHHIVCAWGQQLGVKRRLRRVMPMLRERCKPLWCLGVGNDGQPLHPSRGSEMNQLARYMS